MRLICRREGYFDLWYNWFFLSLAVQEDLQMQNQTCRNRVFVMRQRTWFHRTNESLTTEEDLTENAYLLFGWYQEFFDRHAVPREGASVQGVRPIRTEGAEAVVVTVNHSRVGGDDEMDKRTLMHATLRTGKMAKNIKKSRSWKDIIKNKIPYTLGNFLSSDHLMIRFCLKLGELVFHLWEGEMCENLDISLWQSNQHDSGWLQIIW